MEQRSFVIMEFIHIEAVVILIGKLAFISAPKRNHAVERLIFFNGFILRFIMFMAAAAFAFGIVFAGTFVIMVVIAGAFMRLFALSLNKHPDRIANIVGILPYKFTNGICFKIAVIPFVVSIVLQVQCNNCSVGVLLCGFNCVAVKSFGLPLPCLVAAVCPTENGNLFADHERRIESNTKLADNIHIIFVELVVVFECKRAALGNCAKV